MNQRQNQMACETQAFAASEEGKFDASFQVVLSLVIRG